MTDAPRPYDDIGYELLAEDHAANSPRAALRMLKRKLRGRWWLVFVLAPCLGTICVILGYNAVAPQFQSSGVIRFVRHQPAVLYETNSNQAGADFTAFVATQPQFIMSHEVLGAAVGQLQVSGCEWPVDVEGITMLKQSTNVVYRRGDQFLTVSVTHKDPDIARRAVDALLISYKQLCPVPDAMSNPNRIATLERRDIVLEQSLRELRTGLLEMTDQFGVDTIDDLHTAKVDELITLDGRIADLESAMSDRQSEVDEAMIELPIYGRFGLDSFTVMNEDESSPVDESVIPMLDDAIELHAEMQIWKEKYGANHPRLRALEEQLKLLRVNQEMRQANFVETIGAELHATAEPMLATAALPVLQSLWTNATALRSSLKDDAAELGCQQVELATIQDRITTIEDQLVATRKRLDHLRVENRPARAGFLTIAAHGDVPVTAESDRRLALAIISALFGIGATVAMIAGIGVIDPRCRFAEELEDVTTDLPLLALLPDLSGRQPHREALAAHAIHQLRNYLETHNAEQLRGVYAVTSVDRGEGRTSVTLALGASFAAAGCRTLLIDADVSQCSLTDELGLTNKPGLCESIGQADGAGQMYQTQSANLWALPVGAARDFNPHDLSFLAMKRLVESVRGQFDAVIIDTGPVTTSLEGGLAATVCDQVLLLVGRFQSRRLVASAIQELGQLGANCIGFVFNRAAKSDFRRLPVLETSNPQSVASLVQSNLMNHAGEEAVVAHPFNATRGADQRKAA